MADLLGAARRHRLSLFALAMLVVVAWLVWSARGALPAFVIGLALAFILDPVVTAVERLGAPRWLGVLGAYALVVAIVWVLVAFVAPPIGRQARELIERGPEFGAAIGAWEQDLERWYGSLALPPELREMIDASIQRGREAFGELLQAIAGPVVSTLVRTLTFVLGLVIIPVWLFFVLKDRAAFPRAVAGALPPAWRSDGDSVLAILARVGGRWVRGQLLLGAAVFMATVTGLAILTAIGFGELGQFMLVLALIAGVLEWFPIIGPIIAAVPAILIALTISPAAVIAVIVLYTAVQQLENNLLVPKVMGDAVELHPAVMIAALVIGGALFGIGGAILAAPIVAIGRDLYRYGFRRLSGEEPLPARAAVLGLEPAPDPDADGPPGEMPGEDLTPAPEAG
ncbi:MAG TPA: AI-2E family transporter [Candidatus Limnocylindria bacterium]|nr:AI-2E family transporter [Candidatus Limnocylindria bacterium]